ncbi:MAG: MSMEG_4193 family putative phosphomutase [Nocardioidaceae bacterium]|nr:MSMEG_4193 family putative phosphomutase [Nocardioidaceae bacterium]
MATLILVRHGRTSANVAGVLAGRSPGVHLDDAGREQARHVGERLSALSVARLVTGPLERTVETGRAIARAQRAELRLRRDRGLTECGYGTWTGRAIKDLAKEPLWRSVQAHPSGVTFPDGESMADMVHRAVATVRLHDSQVADEHGSDALWVAVSHGDVIKAILADALGLHLDQFQRIVVDPASVSVVRYTAHRPFVLHVNDHGNDLSGLQPPPRKRRRGRRSAAVAEADSDAVPGGGAGPSSTPAA